MAPRDKQDCIEEEDRCWEESSQDWIPPDKGKDRNHYDEEEEVNPRQYHVRDRFVHLVKIREGGDHGTSDLEWSDSNLKDL